MEQTIKSEWLDINDPTIHRKLFDKFGNRYNKVIVEEYQRNSNREWVKCTAYNSSENYYLIDGALYWRSGNGLLPCETDFNNEQLNVCWKLVEVVTDFTRITGNTILFENKCRRLHRQDYSDGTCFYSLYEWLERPYPHYARDFSVDEGADNLPELISEMKRQRKFDEEWITKFPQYSEPNRQLIKEQTELIEFMEQLVKKTA